MTPRSLLTSFLLLCACAACGRSGAAGEGGGAALMRRLLSAGRLEVVVEERDLHEPLERAAARLRAAHPDARFEAFVTDGTAPGSSTIPRVVVGTAASNRTWLLAVRTGMRGDRTASPASFVLAGETFSDPADALTATFEDPERPGLPVTVVLGNSAAAVAEACTSIAPAWKPWIRVTHGLQVVRECPLALDGAPYAGEWITQLRSRGARESGATLLPDAGTGLVVHATLGVQPEAARRYAATCARARESVRSWCRDDPAWDRTDLWLWGDAGSFVEEGETNALGRCDPLLARVDALLVGTSDDGGAAAARAAAWSALGAPSHPWMDEAAGTEAAWSWWGRPLDPWLARVAPGRPGRLLARITAPDAEESTSRHVTAPLRAAAWRWLREARGDRFARELWRGTRVLEITDAEEDGFAAWLADRIARQGSAGAHTERRAPDEIGVLRGVGVCDFGTTRGRRRARGFGTYPLQEQLDQARESGANTLLVADFSVDRPAPAWRFGDTHARLLAPREGDLRVASALLAGSARGMRTVLAVNLLAGEGGTWSGSWARGDETGWSQFFDRYAAFVEHHGLLAELAGVSLLSLGTGLDPVSNTHVVGRRPSPFEEAWKQAGWTRVIAAARRSFDGSLTYTAGSVLELDALPFCDQLDFVSLSLAPTLERDDTSDGIEARVEITAAIDASLEALARKARATRKPALLGEVCFSPTLRGAARAYGSAHTSIDWQAQQYLDLGERLKVWDGLPLLRGLVAWRIGSAEEESPFAPVLDTQRVRDAVHTLFDVLPAR